MQRQTIGRTLLALVVASLAATVPGRAAPAATGPVPIVAAQVEAFNRGDAAAFADCYADDVEMFDLGADPKPNLVGRAALVARYDPMLRKYHPRVTILSRIESGDFVIDKERTVAGGRSSDGVAIYQVEAGKIRRVWFTP